MHLDPAREAQPTHRLVKIGFLACFAFAAGLMISSLSKAEGAMMSHPSLHQSVPDILNR